MYVCVCVSNAQLGPVGERGAVRGHGGGGGRGGGGQLHGHLAVHRQPAARRHRQHTRGHAARRGRLLHYTEQRRRSDWQVTTKYYTTICMD